MKIELNITGLEPLVKAITALAGGNIITLPEAAPAPAAKKKKAPAKKEAPEKEAAPAKEPAPAPAGPTVDELADLARKVIASSSPAELRKLLDSVIKPSEKVTTTDPSNYPAIHEVLTKALA